MTDRIQRTSTTQQKSGQLSSLWCPIRRHFSEISIYQRRPWKMSCRESCTLYILAAPKGIPTPCLTFWGRPLTAGTGRNKSVLEWPHLGKTSPRTQETISYLWPRLQSCWFHSQRDERSYTNLSSAKKLTTQTTKRSSPPGLCDTVHPQFNTSWQSGRQPSSPSLIYKVASCQ